MSEFKGTKGKWEVSKNNTFGRQMIDLGDFKGSIDVWYHNGDTMTKQEAKANALLISKAPEMLDKLKEVLIMVDWSYELRNSSDGTTMLYEIEELIKEATEL